MTSEQLNLPKAVSVDVKNLYKSYEGQAILKDINFSVAPGETFVLMGPSGSGKSVLLKQIIGLEKADKGQVLINGLDASNSATYKTIRTAIVFQAGALFNSMTVFDNLAFYPREHRLYPKKVIEEKVNYTLKILSLQNAAHKYPSELSGGMRKRVAIARALIIEPQLLLYDEPTSELDPIMSATISEIIATLKENFEVTSIVVSHDRELAYSIGDRVAILFDGQIRTIAKPSDLRNLDESMVQGFLNPKINPKQPRFRTLGT